MEIVSLPAVAILILITGIALLYVWRPAVRDEFYPEHVRPRRAAFTYELGQGEIGWLVVGSSVTGRADFPPHVGDRLNVRAASGEIRHYRIQTVDRLVRGTEFSADVRLMTGDELEAWA